MSCSWQGLDPNCVDERCIYRCMGCGVHHARVEAGGIYDCPNPLCSMSGAAWFRGSLPSFRWLGNGRHEVAVEELIERGMALEVDPVVAEARERSRAKLLERAP